MTKQEAINLVDKNIHLIDKRVKYDNSICKINRFLIDQFEKDNFKVIISLEKERGIEFITDFSEFTNYEIL